MEDFAGFVVRERAYLTDGSVRTRMGQVHKDSWLVLEETLPAQAVQEWSMNMHHVSQVNLSHNIRNPDEGLKRSLSLHGPKITHSGGLGPSCIHLLSLCIVLKACFLDSAPRLDTQTFCFYLDNHPAFSPLLKTRDIASVRDDTDSVPRERPGIDHTQDDRGREPAQPKAKRLSALTNGKADMCIDGYICSLLAAIFTALPEAEHEFYFICPSKGLSERKHILFVLGKND